MLALAIFAGYRFATWPGFALAHLEVRGEQLTPRAEIVARAALQPQANIWLQRLGPAEQRIEALPYVRTAHLHRVPPATIAIDIVERTPDGCVLGAAGAEALVDSDGRVLSATCATGQRLPTFLVPALSPPRPGGFTGDDALARLQADARALAPEGTNFVRFQHDGYGDVEATLPDGVMVLFGAEGDLQAKARLVEPILRASNRRSAIVAIDLRAPAAPVVRYRAAAAAAKASQTP